MKQIFCLFDYMPTLGTTGYSRVSENIVPAIKQYFGDKIQLTILAINFFPQKDEQGFGIPGTCTTKDAYGNTVHSAMYYDGFNHPAMRFNGNQFGLDAFLDAIRHGNFDGIFIMQDIGVIQSITQHIAAIKEERKQHNKKQFKSVFYFPVDTVFYPTLNGLEVFDQLITYTNWGRNYILSKKPELRQKLMVIPHGIDNNVFVCEHALSAMSLMEKHFYEHAHKFIVGNINRNTPRKNMPDTILAFARFKEMLQESNHASGCPVFLYLHCNPNDPLGYNLEQIATQAGLIKNVDYCFPAKENTSVEELVELYNCLSLFISTATGGGWELTVTEAMACGIPCIIPKHSSFIELGANHRAVFLEELELFCNDREESTLRYRICIEEAAEKMMACYVEYNTANTNTVFSSAGENALNWLKSLTWKNINQQWISVFKNTYKL